MGSCQRGMVALLRVGYLTEQPLEEGLVGVEVCGNNTLCLFPAGHILLHSPLIWSLQFSGVMQFAPLNKDEETERLRASSKVAQLRTSAQASFSYDTSQSLRVRTNGKGENCCGGHSFSPHSQKYVAGQSGGPICSITVIGSRMPHDPSRANHRSLISVKSGDWWRGALANLDRKADPRGRNKYMES